MHYKKSKLKYNMDKLNLLCTPNSSLQYRMFYILKIKKTYNKSSVLVLHAYILFSKRKNIYEKVLFITAGREDKTAYKTKIYLSSYLVFIQRQAEAQNSNKEFRQVTSTSILAKMSAQFIRNPAVKMASK